MIVIVFTNSVFLPAFIGWQYSTKISGRPPTLLSSSFEIITDKVCSSMSRLDLRYERKC